MGTPPCAGLPTHREPGGEGGRRAQDDEGQPSDEPKNDTSDHGVPSRRAITEHRRSPLSPGEKRKRLACSNGCRVIHLPAPSPGGPQTDWQGPGGKEPGSVLGTRTEGPRRAGLSTVGMQGERVETDARCRSRLTHDHGAERMSMPAPGLLSWSRPVRQRDAERRALLLRWYPRRRPRRPAQEGCQNGAAYACLRRAAFRRT